MINVTIGESKTQNEKPFPKLMISSDYGDIVYMLSQRTGVMMYYSGGGENLIGVLYNCYNMEFFTDYNEPITLQNA